MKIHIALFLSLLILTSTTSFSQTKPEENPYAGLRALAFTAKPGDYGIDPSEKKTIVYGMVMDWNMEGEIITVVASNLGDASIYLSSGTAVIGGGQHKSVNKAAKEFVNVAQSYLKETKKTEITPLPEHEMVKFYLLTNKGIYVGEEKAKHFHHHASLWMKLFEAGNQVITEIRKVEEK